MKRGESVFASKCCFSALTAPIQHCFQIACACFIVRLLIAIPKLQANYYVLLVELLLRLGKGFDGLVSFCQNPVAF